MQNDDISGNFDEARGKFTEANTIIGGRPDLLYDIALCFYRTKQYIPALKHIAEIIEKVCVFMCMSVCMCVLCVDGCLFR
jgi:hypothetical protein